MGRSPVPPRLPPTLRRRHAAGSQRHVPTPRLPRAGGSGMGRAHGDSARRNTTTSFLSPSDTRGRRTQRGQAPSADPRRRPTGRPRGRQPARGGGRRLGSGTRPDRRAAAQGSPAGKGNAAALPASPPPLPAPAADCRPPPLGRLRTAAGACARPGLGWPGLASLPAPFPLRRPYRPRRMRCLRCGGGGPRRA